VNLDPDISKGCSLHAQYLAKNSNHPSTKGLGIHNEDPKLPGYTEEGEKSGKFSNVVETVDPVNLVDWCMASLFHRVPVLDPKLTKVGFGYAKGGKLGGYVVLDTVTSREGKEAATPIIYPIDKQKEVPLLFAQGENPSPIPEGKPDKAGYPVTVFFALDAEVKLVSASLKDSAKKDVPVWLSSPDMPAAGRKDYQRNTICLIPQAPLRPNTSYTITVKALVDKQEWSKTWSFSTAKKRSFLDHKPLL
jgi:hypothetical protein